MSRAFRLPSGQKILDSLIASWTTLVFIFLYLPIALLVAFSFNSSRLNIRWEGFTFEWYRALLDDTALMIALKNSVIIAAATTAISVILGTAGAWIFHRYRLPLRRVFGTLLVLPMLVPEIIMGISLLILFTAVTHQLERWQEATSAPEWFSDLEIGLGFTTVVISHVTFCFPFVLVAVQARLAGADPALEEAALDLGATPLRAFWHVMMPYMMPAIIAGGLMAFTLSMDEIIVTYFTTGPDSTTLPLRIFGRVKRGLDPSLNAISAVFILATAVLVGISERIRNRSRQRGTAAQI